MTNSKNIYAGIKEVYDHHIKIIIEKLNQL